MNPYRFNLLAVGFLDQQLFREYKQQLIAS